MAMALGTGLKGLYDQALIAKDKIITEDVKK